MNTADYCAEGRELYAEYIIWMNEIAKWDGVMVRMENAKRDAYRRFKEHVDGCPICKSEEN